MGQAIIQVDAFTATPFAGNPAAVCVLETQRDERWMQQVAQEMNLSETAFLIKQADGYELRWFTPIAEVALCGHATLASAHVLWEGEHLQLDQAARFHTRSGLLTAQRQGDWIELNFPAIPPMPATPPAGLLAALGVDPVWIGKSRFDYVIVVEDEALVRALQPNFSALQQIDGRGFIVTSRASTAPYDFVSRCFYPPVGVAEDPVTGSAHCALAPYWSEQLGKTEFVAYQASARGGVLRLRVADDRVYLSGQAVTVLRGKLVQE